MRHRVLFVIQSLAQGGAERQMLALIARLDPCEFECVLCTLADEPPHYADMVPAGTRRVCLDVDGVGLARGFRRLLALLDRERPDLVQSFMDRANLWSRAASALAGGPPVITSVRAPWMRPRYLLCERVLARQVGRAVVVNSRATADELRSWARVPPERTYLVHNVVEFDRFRPPSVADRRAARRRFALEDDELVLLLSGRLSLQKNQLGLALALARLRARGGLPDRVRVLLAGRTWDGWYGALVPPAFRAAGLGGLVRHVGVVPEADVTALYAAADALLLPSLFEGLPNVVLEAQSAGLPAVVSDKANCDRIVADGETGFVAGLDLGMSAYADAVARVIALSPAARAQMGRRGRARVRELFDPERAVARWVSLFRAAIAGPRMPTPAELEAPVAFPGM